MAWHDDALADLTATIGQPLPNIDVAILDPKTGAVLPIGEQGEICTRGYHVMVGYNDNPEATAKAIDADGWLHTGDLGRMDARGYVAITGRVKEMIIRGGENLFPAEIENAMLEHEDVGEVAVIGVPCPVYGEQVACFMRPSGSRRPGPGRAEGVHPRAIVTAKDAEALAVGRPMAADRLGQDPEIQARRAIRARRASRGGSGERRAGSIEAPALVGRNPDFNSAGASRPGRLLQMPAAVQYHVIRIVLVVAIGFGLAGGFNRIGPGGESQPSRFLFGYKPIGENVPANPCPPVFFSRGWRSSGEQQSQNREPEFHRLILCD